VNSSDASNEVRVLAELLQAGVITTPEGKGSISDRHPLSLGVPRRTPDPLSDYFQGCDVVVAVGTRFAEAPIIESQTIIQIDLDPAELGRNHPNTLGVLGDAKSVLEQMTQGLSNAGHQASSKEDFFEGIREQRREQAQNTQPQGEFIKAIREVMPDDGILISGMTQVGYYSRWAYPVFEPRTYLTSSYYGNLGYAYPTALGAKIAQPDRAVVAISGDGGFLFNSQELATAAMYGINVVVIVFNDNAFGNVYRDQMNRFEGRVIGSQLKNPDFVKLAEAYGVEGFLARDAAELKIVLGAALTKASPCLIEVPVGMMPYPF
jgi:acetolactate synthase-1/2/3 large subunit